MHALFRSEAADEADDLLLSRRVPLAAQRLRPLLRMEAHRVHATPPVADVADAVITQVLDRWRRRRERHLARIMDGAQPLPHAVGQRGGVILRGKARDIGLVERHRRDAQLARRESPRRAENEGAGQVHDVRLEFAQGVVDHRGGHADRQRIHAGDLHGGHAHNGKPQVVADFLLACAGARGDDDRFVARGVEVLQHAQNGVGHPVDVREERLGDDGNAHGVHPKNFLSARKGIGVKAPRIFS